MDMTSTEDQQNDVEHWTHRKKYKDESQIFGLSKRKIIVTIKKGEAPSKSKFKRKRFETC